MSSPLRENKPVVLLSAVFTLISAGIALYLKQADWAIGVVAGGAVSFVNFYFLYEGFATVYDAQQDAAETRGGGGVGKAVTRKFMLRYLLLAAAFLAAFKLPKINFVGFAAGFFIVHLTMSAFSLIKLFRSHLK